VIFLARACQQDFRLLDAGKGLAHTSDSDRLMDELSGFVVAQARTPFEICGNSYYLGFSFFTGA
jgi:hypothetical protein